MSPRACTRWASPPPPSPRTRSPPACRTWSDGNSPSSRHVSNVPLCLKRIHYYGYDYQQWKASTVLWHRFKSQQEAAVKDSHSSGCQPLSNIGHSSASEIRPSLSVSKISKHSSSAAAVGSCSLCCDPISCRYSLKQTLCSVWSAEMLPAILLALSSDAEMVLAITASSHLRVDVSLWYSH